MYKKYSWVRHFTRVGKSSYLMLESIDLIHYNWSVKVIMPYFTAWGAVEFERSDKREENNGINA
jgi:hypothetical protein